MVYCGGVEGEGGDKGEGKKEGNGGGVVRWCDVVW